MVPEHATSVYSIDQFRVGDFVRHRTWSVPPGDDPQQPIVEKRRREITEISPDGEIRCGRFGFDAFELIPA